MALYYRSTWYAYLIELERPIGSTRHAAQYYLGIAHDYLARLATHRLGNGARMLAYCVEQKISFEIVRVWQFPDFVSARAFEVWAKKSLKSHKKLLNHPSLPFF